jgi:DNA polymerase-3 subunit gamma/tau
MLFDEVIGQRHVTETLKNALASGRLAHAFIFSGSRGCGKTTTARILAKAVNCLSPNGSDPDNTCSVCEEITGGRSLDVIEIDGASNRGIEEIRNLRESVRFTPARAKFKVYIIDEVHMLTKEAFNALLKTLEEPPPHVIFVFATTEVHKVPATILSRCQRFDFRRISLEEIGQNLQAIAAAEKVNIDSEALVLLAKKGDGSLRDAQSFFDQIRSFCGNSISKDDVLKTLNVVDEEYYFRVSDLIRSKNQKGGIDLVDEIVMRGFDLREFVSGLSEHLRNVLIVRTTGSTKLVETSDHFRRRYETIGKDFEEPDLLRLIKSVNDLEQSMRWAPQPRLKLEVVLLQMIGMEKSVRIDDLVRQLEELKKKLSERAGQSEATGKTSAIDREKFASPGNTPGAVKDVRVVGNVSAGPLRSAAAMVVSRDAVGGHAVAAPRFSGVGPGYAAEAAGERKVGVRELPSVQVAGVGRMEPISAEEAYGRWQDWVSEVRRTRISVGSVLNETEIVNVSSGAVWIGCPDDYHVASLKRNREFLADSFRQFTGRDMRIEVVMRQSDVTAQRLHNVKESSAPYEGAASSGKKNRDETGEHPVIAALRRELGAELVG